MSAETKVRSSRWKSTEEILRTAYVEAESGCWEWQRAISPKGYGWLWRGNRKYLMAHIASYEHHVGPVPDGLVLDHLCRNRACINPAHLEPVLNKVNVLRGEGITAINARKTHCDNGHEFTPENIYTRRGTDWRACRECMRVRDRARKAAARIARGGAR